MEIVVNFDIYREINRLNSDDKKRLGFTKVASPLVEYLVALAISSRKTNKMPVEEVVQLFEEYGREEIRTRQVLANSSELFFVVTTRKFDGKQMVAIRSKKKIAESLGIQLSGLEFKLTLPRGCSDLLYIHSHIYEAWILYKEQGKKGYLMISRQKMANYFNVSISTIRRWEKEVVINVEKNFVATDLDEYGDDNHPARRHIPRRKDADEYAIFVRNGKLYFQTVNTYSVPSKAVQKGTVGVGKINRRIKGFNSPHKSLSSDRAKIKTSVKARSVRQDESSANSKKTGVVDTKVTSGDRLVIFTKDKNEITPLVNKTRNYLFVGKPCDSANKANKKANEMRSRGIPYFQKQGRRFTAFAKDGSLITGNSWHLETPALFLKPKRPVTREVCMLDDHIIIPARMPVSGRAATVLVAS